MNIRIQTTHSMYWLKSSPALKAMDFHSPNSVSWEMPTNQSMVSAEQQFAISFNLKSITPTPQLFYSSKITDQRRIFSTQPMQLLQRMNHVKRRTSGLKQDRVHRLSDMLLNPNMTKLNSLNPKFAHCKIWATPTPVIPQSSIAPMRNLVSSKKSLCALQFLIKSLAAFDSTNVKR